jgi:hypothetical protein
MESVTSRAPRARFSELCEALRLRGREGVARPTGSEPVAFGSGGYLAKVLNRTGSTTYRSCHASPPRAAEASF